MRAVVALLLLLLLSGCLHFGSDPGSVIERVRAECEARGGVLTSTECVLNEEGRR